MTPSYASTPSADPSVHRGDDGTPEIQAINALVDIAHEFTFYFDGAWGRTYLRPICGRDARLWAVLSAADLSLYNLLVIHQGCSPCPYTDSDLAVVRRFVEQEGGGLLLIADRHEHHGSAPFQLNTLASVFGAEFQAAAPEGVLQWSIDEVQGIFPAGTAAGVQGEPTGTICFADAKDWVPVLVCSESDPVAAVRTFGRGRVAFVHGRLLFGEKPAGGDRAPNTPQAQALSLWLTDGKKVDPIVDLQDQPAESRHEVHGVTFQYPAYLESYRDPIAELYSQVSGHLDEILGVPLSPGALKTVRLTSTSGGGFSGDGAIGLGVWWGGYPESRYGMIELIGHESTQVRALPFAEPMWGLGLATYVGMEVARRLGCTEQALRERKAWEDLAAKLDRAYDRIDLTKPETPALHDVYMAKPMWIWDQLRARYGQDIMARYFQTKRRLILPEERMGYSPDDCVAVLSIAAGDDLFPWFKSIGTSVSPDRSTV